MVLEGVDVIIIFFFNGHNYCMLSDSVCDDILASILLRKEFLHTIFKESKKKKNKFQTVLRKCRTAIKVLFLDYNLL